MKTHVSAHLIDVTQATLRAMERDQERAAFAFLAVLRTMREDRDALRNAFQNLRCYFEQGGTHTHARLFISGAHCGNLCFRNAEFDGIRSASSSFIQFLTETTTSENQKYDYDTKSET